MIMSYFHEGQRAFRNGVCAGDNPYHHDSEAYRSWDDGWNDAWFADKDPGFFS